MWRGWWGSWCEGVGDDGDVVVCGAAPLRPGHTPLTAFAPLSSGTKGAWIPGCAGMTGLGQG